METKPKLTRSDWLKFSSWALIYPALIGLIDVYLYLNNLGTITRSSRLIFTAYPWLGFIVGAIFVGLVVHFFWSHINTKKTRPAFWFFVAGGVVSTFVLMFVLFG